MLFSRIVHINFLLKLRPTAVLFEGTLYRVFGPVRRGRSYPVKDLVGPRLDLLSTATDHDAAVAAPQHLSGLHLPLDESSRKG